MIEENVFPNSITIKHVGVTEGFEKWMKLAKERIFSIAAGNRIGDIAPKIMEVGYAKVLYAATRLGADIDTAKTFVMFAPDGTCSLNLERTRRGFSYGGIFRMSFDGMIATNNSMPNGCGFSVYELMEQVDDDKLVSHLKDAQCRLGEEELKQLGKGNHFAAMYKVKDPVSWEDTGRRFLVVHCSGHVGGDRLYYPDTWLADTDGYHKVDTPHGDIVLLEGDAKNLYVEQFRKTEGINSKNRDKTAQDIFDGLEFRLKDSITHQGLSGNDFEHIIGTQRYNGMMPIALNPEEGLVAVKTNPNLKSAFLDGWKSGERVYRLGLERHFLNLNLTPHGGGYELKHPFEAMQIQLGKEGIKRFTLKMNGEQRSFTYFREVRDWLTYRRKMQIMKEVFVADLATVYYDLEPLMQVYPVQSIPGGEA